jgi:hypothetical protein
VYVTGRICLNYAVMPADTELLDAVHLAVQTSPRSLTLRLHLGYLLLEAGRPAEALEQCALVMVRVPDHPQALDLAARAAAADARRALPVLPRPLRGSGFRVEPALLNFASVGGMTSVKRQLAAMAGASASLLYGPPGCGKSFIARALAGELGAGFLAVKGGRVVDLWNRDGRHPLVEAFALARANAPCLLFLDELDALGRGARDVPEQLVAELAGVGDHDGVTVVAASERPWEIPSVLEGSGPGTQHGRGRGQGGLGPRLLVLPPDRVARQVIIRGALRSHPLDELNLAALAGRTESFSATDLIALCDLAARLTLQTAMARGVRPIGMEDFNGALRQLQPSPLAWFDLARDSLRDGGEDAMDDAMDIDLRAYLSTVIPKGAA